MKLSDAVRNRRSIKRFTDREISRDDVETILTAAVQAPNHRLTQPWRFYVLGPEARHGYGMALGDRKAKKIEDPAAAQKMRDTVAAEHRALPLMIGVAVIGNENPEIAEEDYASTMMAVQNLSLAAVELGLGSAIRSGAILNDPAALKAMGVGAGERVVAMVNVGEPAEVPPGKSREATTYTKMDAINFRTHTTTKILLAAVVVVLAPPASAQKFTPPAITWCDAVAKKPEWTEQTVYLSLAETRPNGTSMLSPTAVQDILVSIATRMRALPGLSAANTASTKGALLPSADALYTPGSLMGDVQFQMTPDGQIGRIAFHDVRDSALAHDLRGAIKNVSAAAPRQDVDSLVRFHTFIVAPSLKPVAPFASFPLFRMFVPVTHDIEMTKRSRREIPPGFENWNVDMRLSFFVDTTGKIERETVHPIPSPAELTFKNSEQRQVFLNYVNTATQLFQESQYKPAEYLGCRIRQEISYSMFFRAGITPLQ